MSIADEIEQLQHLHQTGALSDAEFADAKAAVLARGALNTPTALDEGMHASLAALQQQQVLLRVDQDWQVEREAYLIRGRIPTKTDALWMGAVLLVLGLCGICAAAGLPSIMIQIGLVAFASSGGLGGYYWYKASAYEVAEARYLGRRSQAAAHYAR